MPLAAHTAVFRRVWRACSASPPSGTGAARLTPDFCPIADAVGESRTRSSGRNLGKMAPAQRGNPRLQAPRTDLPAGGRGSLVSRDTGGWLERTPATREGGLDVAGGPRPDVNATGGQRPSGCPPRPCGLGGPIPS